MNEQTKAAYRHRQTENDRKVSNMERKRKTGKKLAKLI